MRTCTCILAVIGVQQSTLNFVVDARAYPATLIGIPKRDAEVEAHERTYVHRISTVHPELAAYYSVFSAPILIDAMAKSLLSSLQITDPAVCLLSA